MTSPAGDGRHQGQRREPGGAGRSSSISPASGHDLARRPARGERGGRDGADDVSVALGLASDQHAVTMARRRSGRNRISPWSLPPVCRSTPAPF
jgi:hypothetical protein